MAECLELTKGSLFMDQLLKDLPNLKEWLERFNLSERFFLYREYNEPRYCMEVHIEDDTLMVYLIKLTEDIEFFGDLLKQIKYVMPSTKMPFKIITTEKYDVLWRQLKWKRFKEEIITDEFNRKTYIYQKK